VIAVVGAGAIGGLLAAELIAAGHEVTLCARRPIDRLVIRRERPLDVRVTSVTAPADLARADWAFVALKGPDLPGAAPWLEAATGPETVVVAVQNGVEHRENLTPYAHGAPVLPALAYTGVERVEAGIFKHFAGNKLIVPAGPGADRFATLFDSTALDVEREPDFLTASWRKLLTNIPSNPITALTLGRMAVLDVPSLRALTLGLLREAVEVGRAEGAALEREDAERTLAFYDALPRDGGTSMLYDRLAGRRLEHDLLTGAVVRAAGRHGLEVPLNQAILALLEGLDHATLA
jgi:2-dehydropantoate 2-reductase